MRLPRFWSNLIPSITPALSHLPMSCNSSSGPLSTLQVHPSSGLLVAHAQHEHLFGALEAGVALEDLRVLLHG